MHIDRCQFIIAIVAIYTYVKSLCCIPKMNTVICKYYLNFLKLAKNKNTHYKYRNGKNLNAPCVIGLELGDDSVKLLSSMQIHSYRNKCSSTHTHTFFPRCLLNSQEKVRNQCLLFHYAYSS